MQVSQDDRNLAMVTQAFVVVTGLAAVLPAFATLGLIASIGSLVLYFIWKTKSPFVVRFAKQAAGLQIVLFLLGILVVILGSGAAFTSIAAGSVGGLFATAGLMGLMGLLGLVVGVLTLIVGILGLMRAKDGVEYLYPVIGRWVDELKF